MKPSTNFYGAVHIFRSHPTPLSIHPPTIASLARDVIHKQSLRITWWDTYETFTLMPVLSRRYNLMTIQYTERIVSCRKNLRQRIFKELCQLRKYYFQLLRLLDEFCGKYNINRKARCLVVPRGVEYSFGVTWPSTVRCKELINIYDNCFNDYKYLTDIIAKLNFPDNSPLCGRRQQLLDNLIAIWWVTDQSRFNRSCRQNYSKLSEKFPGFGFEVVPEKFTIWNAWIFRKKEHTEL